MDIQLTDDNGYQLRLLEGIPFDCELNDGDRDFAFTISSNDYHSDIDYGCRVFVKNTEIGGIIGKIDTDTSDYSITYSGYTWRGLLDKKIIMPPSDSAYKTVSGELNEVIGDLIDEIDSDIFSVSTESTGVSVTNYQFDRFCTLREGIVKMLKSVNYRLEINYDEGDPNGAGHVDLSALPIADYSSQIELSQDSQLNFTTSVQKNGVNHLVVGGKGEGTERTVLNLYVKQDGTISTSSADQYYFGDDEIVSFYDNTSTESDDLEEKSIEELESLMNRQEFVMDVETLDIDIAIGDIVGGRDFITGAYIKKPLENIVYEVDRNGKVEKTYTLEGDD